MKQNKIKYALRSSFVGLIAGVCVQYIVEVVIKIMKKENIPNILTIIRFILIPFIYISVL